VRHHRRRHHRRGQEHWIQSPLVVRLEGTNVELARKMLDGAREKSHAPDRRRLTDAAKKITAAVG